MQQIPRLVVFVLGVITGVIGVLVVTLILRFVPEAQPQIAFAPTEPPPTATVAPTSTPIPPPRQAVLDYLSGLAGSGVIVGQFGSYGEQTSIESANEQIARVFELTERWPALTGFDLQRPDQTPEQSIADAVAYARAKHAEGYLISFSWHAKNPCTGDSASYQFWDEQAQADIPPLDGTRILEGGDCRAQWLAQLDLVADGLAQLAAERIVILWRPFHEMNGAWFWWHRQEQQTFAAIWRDMHRYFTQTKGLDNLLWVYSPNTPWDEWAQRADYYYPGDDVVDLVGLDHYMRVDEETLDLNRYGGYDQMVALGKPFGLFEFGPIPSSGEGWDTKAYCWSRLLDDIQTTFPQIVLFQAWEYVWQIGREPFTCQRELLARPLAITLDELPQF